MRRNSKKVIFIVAVFIVFLIVAFAYITLRPLYLANKIDKLVEVSASDISQCKTIGFGDKPCGGFKEFIIYSSESTNEEKLIDAVDRYNMWDERKNFLTKAASTCDFVQPPRIVLSEGKCSASTASSDLVWVERCDGSTPDSFYEELHETSYEVLHKSGKRVRVDNCGIPTVYDATDEQNIITLFQAERPQAVIAPVDGNREIENILFSPGGEYLQFSVGAKSVGGVRNMLMHIPTQRFVEINDDLMWDYNNWDYSGEDSFLAVFDLDQAWGHDNLYVVTLEGSNAEMLPVFVNEQGVPTPEGEVLEQVHFESVQAGNNGVIFTVRSFLNGEQLPDTTYSYDLNSKKVEKLR